MRCRRAKGSEQVVTKGQDTPSLRNMPACYESIVRIPAGVFIITEDWSRCIAKAPNPANSKP